MPHCPSVRSRLPRSAWPTVWLTVWLGCLALFAAPSQAATYAFRSDSFAWETAATAVTWTKTCTSYANDDDKAVITFTGGFTFSFAGVAYPSVTVMTNGMLQFGPESGVHRTYTNTALPVAKPGASGSCAALAPTNVMAAYWTDLDPNHAGSGGVTWQQKGTAPNRYVVISWNAVFQYGTSTPYTFQIILYENGEFKYQYGNANASGSNATIGVQVSATDYTLYSYNSGYNANGVAIRWFKPSGTPTRTADYRMDEFSWAGNIGEVADSSGNGHGGVRVGSTTATSASGYVCRALNVPANTTTTINAVDTSLDVDTGIGASGSVSMWVTSNGLWSSATPALMFDATLSASRAFYLMRSAGGALRFVVTDSAGTALTTTTAAQAFSASTWVHLAATWRLAAGSNQSTIRLYVNGALQATTVGTTTGNLDSSIGTLFIGDNRSTATPTGGTASSANGRIDEVRIYNYEISAAELAADMSIAHSCAPPLHHLEIQHASGSGVTCAPTTLTLAACQDAACTSYYTGGVTATIAASGAGVTTNWPSGTAVSIPVGSGTTTWPMQVSTAGSVSLSLNSPTPSASSAATCNFGSPSCTFTAADSGFVFDVPNHVSEVSQTVSVSAVRKSDSAGVCVPAFASVSKSVTFTCGYSNPGSGTLPVRVGARPLNASGNSASACDSTGQAVSLSFNASGVASTTVQYADVGSLSLSARYAGSSGGEVGLVMSGSDSFTAAPASFTISGVTAGPIKAGTSFSATVSARNNAGATTPNFGRESVAESVSLSFARRSPTGAGASNGAFTGSVGSFSSGSMTSSNLVWSEVGSGDLTATLKSASYLGTGFTATGTTGAAGTVGSFIPHHFDVTVAPACGAFSYAGQPFAATITARNGLATPGITLNYDGSASTTPNQAVPVTLSEGVALGTGSLGSTASVAASAFKAGVASAAPVYAFTNKQTPAQSLVLRATDKSGVSSSGWAEGSMPLRSGRLRLANGFGTEKSALLLPVMAEYWSGGAWILNTADSCTTVPANIVALSNYRSGTGASVSSWTTTASAITISAGLGSLQLSAPSPSSTGSVELALNLGGGNLDQSCLSNHPKVAAGSLAWLRSRFGSCAATWDRDPSARASFGVFAPETQKSIHARELF